MRTQSLQVTDEFKDKVDSLAEKEGRSTSDFIRGITEVYVEYLEDETMNKILDDLEIDLIDWMKQSMDQNMVLHVHKKLPLVNAIIYKIAKGKSA